MQVTVQPVALESEYKPLQLYKYVPEEKDSFDKPTTQGQLSLEASKEDTEEETPKESQCAHRIESVLLSHEVSEPVLELKEGLGHEEQMEVLEQRVRDQCYILNNRSRELIGQTRNQHKVKASEWPLVINVNYT